MKEFDYSDENIERLILVDYFNRNAKLLTLIDLLQRQIQSQIIAIDGAWGIGKTVFVHQLGYLIKNKEFRNKLLSRYLINYKKEPNMQSFYFNAWENDMINNPAITLLYSLVNEFKLFDVENAEKYTNILNRVIHLTTKIVSLGMLGKEDFSSQHKSKFDKILTVNSVRNEITQILDDVLESNEKDKIIVIIDELDRCRPTYAIEMLETLKHFYDNNNVIFIISTNIEQLANTVKKLYGNQYNAEMYLKRFFSNQIALKREPYDTYLLQELKVTKDDRSSFAFEACTSIIDQQKVELREVNKIIDEMKFKATYLDSSNTIKYAKKIARIFLLPLGIVLKHKETSVYNSYKNGELDALVIETYLALYTPVRNEIDSIAKHLFSPVRNIISNGERTERELSTTEKEKKITEIIIEIYHNIFAPVSYKQNVGQLLLVKDEAEELYNQLDL